MNKQWQLILAEDRDRYKALAGELAEAIAAHRYDVWGHGSVGHEMDERLYAALARYEQEKGV
jgi:predicted esterase